jgi:hypothetical protein
MPFAAITGCYNWQIVHCVIPSVQKMNDICSGGGDLGSNYHVFQTIATQNRQIM